MEKIFARAKEMQNELVEWRRQIHKNPELGMELPITSAFVKAKLEEMGYTASYIAGTGVTATVGGKKPGKCFMMRADMDALPVAEDSGVEFASTNGKMHACGHDFHTTMLLGAAKLLKEHEDEIEGTVKFMFQPGEETLEGAKAMVEAGILENPKVDAALMIHVAAGMPMPSGVIVIPEHGAFSAASDWFEIEITGKGGHGAMPEKAIDPLNVAAHLHIALQAIHSRELSASDSAVVTVGVMGGGTAHNVIPNTAVLKGTIRTFSEEVRQYIFKRIEEIAENTAKTFKAQAKTNIIIGCPSVLNDGKASKSVRDGLRTVFGQMVPDASVLGTQKMNGSEDFSFVSQKVPSVMMMLSAGSIDEGYQYTMHHPKAVFNEKVLSEGAAVYAISALSWLSDNK